MQSGPRRSSRRRGVGVLSIAVLGAALAAQQPAAKLAAPSPQQPQSQEQLRELQQKKLGKEVFQKAAWRTDLDAARAEAKKDGKLLLVYFTRSYAY